MRLASLSCTCFLILAAGCGTASENADDDGENAGTSGTTVGQGGSSAGSGAGGLPGGTGGTGGTSAAGAGSGGLAAGAGGSATGGQAGSGSSGRAGGGAGGTLAGMSGSSGRAGMSGGGSGGAAGSAGALGGAGSGGSSTGGAGQGGGSGGQGGKAGSAGGGSGGGGNDECPADGNITYTLSRAANPSSDEQDAYDRITEAMDEALDYYNCYTNIERALSISYVPSVQTADGNPNGSIRFGSDRAYMNYITAMHETSHVLGVGSNEWDAMIEDGRFTGPAATAEMQAVTGDPEEYVHGDNQHFWPYGLNYTSEVTGESDLLNHMRIVVAIRVDLGFDDP